MKYIKFSEFYPRLVCKGCIKSLHLDLFSHINCGIMVVFKYGFTEMRFEMMFPLEKGQTSQF